MSAAIDKYELAARLTLAELDGKQCVLSAAQQRRLFGRVIFGRKLVNIDCSNQGRIYGSFSVCFGTDAVRFELSLEQIAHLSNNPTIPISW